MLNVSDLENLLGSGNVEVTTTGSGVQASDIDVTVPVSWSTGSTLSLDAYHSITVASEIAVESQAGLTLATNDGGKGGAFSIVSGGNITFGNLSSELVINGITYSLVNDITSLASGVAANPKGDFALANSYDASGNGTYNQSPVATTFKGNFDGLGNTVSNLTVQNSVGSEVGLFASVERGAVAHIGLVSANVSSDVPIKEIGTLAGYVSKSTVYQAYASGQVSTNSKRTAVGGLIGDTSGVRITNSFATSSVTAASGEAGGLLGYSGIGDIVSLCYATGNVTAGRYSGTGGLIGEAQGTISQSFATGNASVGRSSDAGGLLGQATGMANVSNSYASGSAIVTERSSVSAAGGLIGSNSGVVHKSYSTGAVSENENYAGGLIGLDDSSSGSLQKTYWDTTTSGITNLSQGAGNIANDPGITGETTQQLQSGLPKGFSSKIWSENSNINNGLPYLLANPPPQ